MFQTDKLFRNLFLHSTTANALLNKTGQFIMVNEVYCDLLGYTESELLSMSLEDIIPHTVADLETRKKDTLFTRTSEKTQYKSIRRTKKGRELAVEVNAINTDATSKDDIYIIEQIHTTPQARPLKEDEQQKLFLLDTILNKMPTNIYFKDLKSRFVLVSKQQAKHFGTKDAKDLIGKTDFDFFAKEHSEKAFNDEQNIIKTGRGISVEEKEVWPDGTITWAHTTKQPIKDDEGNTLGTFGISRDITDIKTSERKLREAHQQVERKNKALVVTLQNLRETQAQLVSNEKMAALGQMIAGVAHEINTPLGAINASNSNIAHSLTQVFNVLPKLYANFSGEEVHFITSLLKEANYSTLQLASREKRLLKKQIEEKFKIAGIPNARQLADHIIYMNLQDKAEEIIPQLILIDAEKALSAAKLLISLSKNSNNIALATDKASNVVLALKKFIHRSADDAKSIADIAENIETVLTLNHNKLKHGIEVIKKFDTKVSKIECYPDELSQVWNNIITNAIQSMEGRGTLTLELYNHNNKQISVKISDTGCGIPKELHKKIFEPLFTTKISGEGTGIGLDIVKRIIDKHDGEILLESTVGKGTVFTINLPIKTQLS